MTANNSLTMLERLIEEQGLVCMDATDIAVPKADIIAADGGDENAKVRLRALVQSLSGPGDLYEHLMPVRPDEVVVDVNELKRLIA